MEEKIKNTQEQAVSEISRAATADEVEQLRIKYLGRKGLVNNLFAEIGKVSADERGRIGSLLNELKDSVSAALEAAKARMGGISSLSKVEAVDVTMPGIKRPVGNKHPLTQVFDRINEIFLNLGFKIVEGPEIETDYYNFTALNIPLEHPSRDVFDTFYIDEHVLLRSQTSTVQVRVMEKIKPPFQVIAPGKVYRPDATDASHSFMFHQVEGFMVDKDIKFSDLKGTLTMFAKEMFGSDIKMRFRPHFFPFTEPSAEVDISCIICGGKGEDIVTGHQSPVAGQGQGTSDRGQGTKRCSVCGGKGWLEILGAGMIHPNVFKAVGYDASKWRGFAFGMGVERIAMLKYGVDDIRLFFENDLRFLRQF